MSVPVLRLLLALVLTSTVTCLKKKRKVHSKYPFYRPSYNTTHLVFEPFFRSSSISLNLNQNSDDYQFLELYDFIVQNSHPFLSYHNYNQYMQEIVFLQHLAHTFPWSEFLSINEESKSLESNPLHRIIISNNKCNGYCIQKMKLLFIFGEHPREFIVSESMLDLIHNISLSFIHPNVEIRRNVNSILDTFEIHILPMLNPDGKIYLEKSNNYCWRWNSNSHSVDLNRNFDWEFAGKGSTHMKGSEEWHGVKAFSEPEAQYLNELLITEDYTCVIDIHSGTQQIFVPFVDSKSRNIHRTRDETNEELRLVSHIQSFASYSHSFWFKNSGIAWKFNDYGADGTIMDYIGGVIHVPYSLCAEIYGDPNVDLSIDCFVQFNPNNGQAFIDSIRNIRTLYTATFDYFLKAQNEQEMMNLNIMQTAKTIKAFFLKYKTVY